VSRLPPVKKLIGHSVTLEPLEERHVVALSAAANEDRSTYAFTAVPNGEEEMAAYVQGLLIAQQADEAMPFAQLRRTDDRVVGVTRYLTFRWRDELTMPIGVEIGGTWLCSSAQRTSINREAKLLLLTEAFESWGVGRVDLKTDARNERSRAAIAALGCTFEGVLRSWQPSQVLGEEMQLRDSAMYSIVRDEWPAIKAALLRRIDGPTQ
jgi:N-acetyltransferase